MVESFLDHATGLVMVHRSEHASPAELYRDDANLTDQTRMMVREVLEVFERLRAQHGGPIAISSGRRSEAKQEFLHRNSKRAAKESTHVIGLALDLVVPAGMRDTAFVEQIDKIARDVCGGIAPRLGYLRYRKSPKKSAAFVHFDIAPWASFFVPDAVTHAWPEDWKIPGIVW